VFDDEQFSAFWSHKIGCFFCSFYPFIQLILLDFLVSMYIKMVPSGLKFGKEQLNVLAYADDLVLTFSRLMTYIYMSYRTANLQMLHFIYLFNKYTY
jgi:hypothetical protein